MFDHKVNPLFFSVLALIEKLMTFCFLGLMYVIETQKVLDLKVNLMASYVIIPQTGFYNGTQNILLLDLGHFKVRKCTSNQHKIASKSETGLSFNYGVQKHEYCGFFLI